MKMLKDFRVLKLQKCLQFSGAPSKMTTYSISLILDDVRFPPYHTYLAHLTRGSGWCFPGFSLKGSNFGFQLWFFHSTASLDLQLTIPRSNPNHRVLEMCTLATFWVHFLSVTKKVPRKTWRKHLN
jgi:hypothetical protein